MDKVNALLEKRLKKDQQSSKMAIMAKQSANGDRTSFSGIFSVSDLNENEKASLHKILQEYSLEKNDLDTDLQALISITSEVKAINNQAALLHGERIKKAHLLLTKYRDGAFTAWLMAAYGNRQTPYNLMQYYEFCEAMPKKLRPQIEAMPRQAVYTLASREGPLEKKQIFIENYQGQTKAELLEMIRVQFPLHNSDKRRANLGQNAIQMLERACTLLEHPHASLTKSQTLLIKTLMNRLHQMLKS